MATVIGRNRNKKAQKSFKDMTVVEIKKQLDSLGIEYDKSKYCAGDCPCVHEHDHIEE